MNAFYIREALTSIVVMTIFGGAILFVLERCQ